MGCGYLLGLGDSSMARTKGLDTRSSRSARASDVGLMRGTLRATAAAWIWRRPGGQLVGSSTECRALRHTGPTSEGGVAWPTSASQEFGSGRTFRRLRPLRFVEISRNPYVRCRRGPGVPTRYPSRCALPTGRDSFQIRTRRPLAATNPAPDPRSKLRAGHALGELLACRGAVSDNCARSPSGGGRAVAFGVWSAACGAWKVARGRHHGLCDAESFWRPNFGRRFFRCSVLYF